MARATGCSLSASTAAANASTCSSLVPAVVTTPVTWCRPWVNVPVLSKSTTSTVRMRSSASRSLTSTPDLAARSVEIAITSGIAKPSACGQAMTSTVTVRTTASSTLPSSDHTAKVRTPATAAK